MSSDKKHIVYLFSDQHNGKITGFDGDPYIRTPVLDSLAEKGTAFMNCYSSSPLCVPSRSSMLSGLLPSETGIINNFQSLRSDKVTFAHCISVAGYETVLSGRMHFAGADQRHGFEKRLLGDMTPSFSHLPKNNYGEALRATDFPGPPPIAFSGAGNSAVLEYDKDLTAETKRFLEERTDERPLFLLVGYYGPHCPYVAPKELYDYYFSVLPEPEILTQEERLTLHPAIQNWIKQRRIEDITVADVKRVQAAYYGMVEYLDTLMGELLQVIDQTLGLENTLIIYSSDHGDTLGNNNVFWKTNFYEGSVRVPMVWSLPGVVPQGRKIDGHVSLMDVGPSLISYAGGPRLPKTHGVDLLPQILGGAEDKERYIISQLADVKGDKPSIMIRKGSWKLIHHTGYETVQLFNIENDPFERNDLGTSEDFKEIREELHEEVLKYWDEDHIWELYHEAKAHDEIYKKWVISAQVTGIEEWVCAPEKNFLV